MHQTIRLRELAACSRWTQVELYLRRPYRVATQLPVFMHDLHTHSLCGVRSLDDAQLSQLSGAPAWRWLSRESCVLSYVMAP
jgi:hypothetical protein